MKDLSKKNILIIVCGALLVVATIVFILFQTHIFCIHKWSAATCIKAKECIICGNTEGNPLGHDCTDWTMLKEPTCTELGLKEAACNICGAVVKKEVDKLPHTDGAWVVTKDYTINKDATVTPGVESLCCVVCDEKFKTREYTIELTTGQRNALIKTHKLINSIHPSYDFLVTNLLTTLEGFSLEEAKFAAEYCGANWDEQALLCAKDLMNEGESKNGIIEELRFYMFTEAQINKAIAELNY